MITEKLEKIIQEPQSKPAQACVIWLHGLGASGKDFAYSIPHLHLPPDHKIRFIFPDAPRRAVTLNKGLRMPAWYDIFGLTAQSQEDAPGIEQAYHLISSLIEEQYQEGIPYHKIFLAGFSQGGALSLYTGLQFPQALGGVAALSSYLPLQYQIKKRALSTPDRSLPIFMAHGKEDSIVSFSLGEKSYSLLESLGFKIDWHIYPILHNVCAQEMKDLGQWFLKHLE